MHTHIYLLRLISDQVENHNNSVASFFNNTSVGAFLGAFSAFILGVVTYNYTKRREKWKLHHDGLVKTERLINQHLNEISVNIFLLKGAIEAMESGAFTENMLNLLDNTDYLVDAHNVSLISIYFDYRSLVVMCNHDMAGWNRSVDRLFTAVLSGKVKDSDIERNRQGLIKRSKSIIEFLKNLMEETYTTGAYIRKFMEIDKLDRFARLSRTEQLELTPKQIATERKIFVQESKDTMERDKKRTAKYKE